MRGPCEQFSDRCAIQQNRLHHGGGCLISRATGCFTTETHREMQSMLVFALCATLAKADVTWRNLSVQRPDRQFLLKPDVRRALRVVLLRSWARAARASRRF